MEFSHDPVAESMRKHSGQLCFLSSDRVPVGRGLSREFFVWVHATPDGRLLLTRRTNLYKTSPFKKRSAVRSHEGVQICFASSVAEIVKLLQGDPVPVTMGLMARLPTGMSAPSNIAQIMRRPINVWSQAELTTVGMYIRDNRR